MLSHQLNNLLSALPALLPELALTAGFVLVLGLALFRQKVVLLLMPLVALGSLAVFCYLSVFHYPQLPEGRLLLGGMLRLDGIARYGALLMGLCGLLTMVLAHFYQPLKTRTEGVGEFVMLVLAMVLGLSLMVKAGNLLLLYLAIELVSISSYILTALLRERKAAAEAGLKYVLFGALASGVMIYGLSFLYGLSGTMTFTDPAFGQQLALAPVGLLVVGIVLTFAGFLFKAGAVPMHIWAPDVYEGAPTPIAALFSTAPKVAAVLVLARFLPALPDTIWSAILLPLLSMAALASLLTGNFGALRQKSVKRLMAYSSIAHTGFLIMPLIGGGSTALVAMLFYATVYLVATFAVFALIQLVEGQRQNTLAGDWDGLGAALPVLGVTMVIQMIALTGLPPTGGFTGKLLVFTSVWEQFERLNSAWLLGLLVAGLVLTVVSLFYYLRLPYAMFFKGNDSDITLKFPLQEKLLAIGLAAVMLLMFFKADWLVRFIQWVMDGSPGSRPGL